MRDELVGLAMYRANEHLSLDLYCSNASGQLFHLCMVGVPSQRQCEDATLTAQIVAAHEASRGTYGVPRIVEDLREAGTPTSKRRCGRLTRAAGLRVSPAPPTAAMHNRSRPISSPSVLLPPAPISAG